MGSSSEISKSLLAVAIYHFCGSGKNIKPEKFFGKNAEKIETVVALQSK